MPGDDEQQSIQRMGRGLWRRRRGDRDDRPPRASRRDPLAQGRQLSAQRQGPRERATISEGRGGVKIRPLAGGEFSTVDDTCERSLEVGTTSGCNPAILNL